MRTMFFFVCILVFSMSYAHRIETDNICSLFKHHPDWAKATKATETRWGIPQAVQMAIMNTESKFKAYAKNHHSSARGYAQVINRTWRVYERSTGNYASRSRFAAASNFIGWYAHRMHQTLGISVKNAYEVYLAYHEGLGGYKDAIHHSHSRVAYLARAVRARAARYQAELNRCG